MKKIGYFITPSKFDGIKDVYAKVAELEDDGWVIYFPPRDGIKGDTVGYESFVNHKRELSFADKVFVYWDGDSQAVIFDLGMAFAMNKEIEIISIPELTPYTRSIQNVIAEWNRRSLVSRKAFEEGII